MLAPACRRPRWAARWTRTSCSSVPRWQAERLWQRRWMAFERIGVDEVWNGRIASVRVERWRLEDGEEVEREVVGHPGAVAIVAHDGEQIFLVRQPREPRGVRAARAGGGGGSR